MYTITLFAEATLKTGTPDDKRRVAPHATIGQLTRLESFSAVVEAASRNTISLNEYSRSDKCHENQVHRHGDYFVSTNLIGLDVDDNISISEALARLRALGWKFGLYTSFNHQASGTDKFRVILELDAHIKDPTIYRNTWESIHAEFLGLDKSCKDVARLYFHSNPDTRQVFTEGGKLVPIVIVAPARATKFGPTPPPASKVDAAGFETINIRAKLPIDVRNWMVGIDEYGEPIQFEAGGRNATFFKVVNLAKERGYDRDWCDERLGKTLRDDDDYMRTYGDSKIEATLDQIFSRDSRHAMPTLFGFADLDGPREFINSWLKSKTITVDRNGSFVSGVHKWSPKQLLHTILLDYDEHHRQYNRVEEQKPKGQGRKVRRIGKDAIESAITEYVAARRNEHRAKLIDAIQFCGSEGNLSELRKFIFAMCGKEDETYLAVLAHFIWQVKRKAFHLPVQYHMMPILTGIQGNGKSTAIRDKFLSPVKDFMTRPSLADLADKKRAEAYQYNYVAFCDEMEQADRTDIDGLKNFITTDKLNVREMYSPHELEFAQNCTPIGCTNRSLATLIYDPTGMRRFFEILTDPQLKQNGWGLLDKIDYLKMWKQIDENIPGPDCYIIPLMDSILTHQEELRVESPIESFLIESGAMPIKGDDVAEVASDAFFSDYKMFSNQNGHKTKDKSFFGKHLVNFGITKCRKRVGARQSYFYTVNANYTPLNELT